MNSIEIIESIQQSGRQRLLFIKMAIDEELKRREETKQHEGEDGRKNITYNNQEN